jgi:uncharacterized protein YkvS
MARQTLTAVVEALNERGVKVNGAWHNFSSYAQNGAIDRTAQVGDTVELELTNTGWVRKLTVKSRAASQNNGQPAPQAPSASGTRQLDATQYTRLRAVEIAANVAVQYAEDFDAYLNRLSTLVNWIVAFVEEGDPLG